MADRLRVMDEVGRPMPFDGHEINLAVHEGPPSLAAEEELHA